MRNLIVRTVFLLSAMTLIAAVAVGQSNTKTVTVTLMRWPYT